MRTVLKHGKSDEHAGKVFECFDIEDDWLAIHFTDGTSLLFRSDAGNDDSWICREDFPPEAAIDRRCLRLISQEEYKRAIENEYEADEVERKAKRRAEYEKLKAEFEGEAKSEEIA